MVTSNLISLRTRAEIPEFESVKSYIDTIIPPYTLEDIYGFNRVYKEAYPYLNPRQRRVIENFVDIMIDNLSDKALAKRIFGVV